ncbi:MAG: NADH-quinone oxidoreductase subunit NuoF [Candidatus Eisenbacteria bacterium]|uniref:NADH-quinone oxidoreductase subunit F n=1 Tax=Eiseniibacteriota bacterium TaxID=2212470 RepID=A0A948W539_UNCEI|nr:NADH-quinone oxidoreductase subunit NuoF [Candidatus Eisenbacteria bacterium]MBU1950297.1 NADH-quinone oxidoreductase subunit NuoF [Candidatus Eisenbacteria bacterium]MBU2692887.1 NADH-quinone oxidoreductase subunit NuoF [Candidatus Eisenbacteria bacterium]
MERKIISKNFGVEDSWTLPVYEANGGYAAMRKAFGMDPQAVLEEVKASKIRGRGGAGFPMGLKWSFVPRDIDKPKYLCVNADEGEPGTFKDRHILENDPHMMIEGIIICCWAVGIRKAFIYIRGEFHKQCDRLDSAVREAYEKGYLGRNINSDGFDLDIVVHRGAGAYICGEETGLIESVEGKRGQPRMKPPFPALIGVFDCPTVVNNVETLAALPWILQNGAAAYAAIGTEKSSGTKLWSISGHVERPGVYELDMGVPLRVLLEEHAGGVRNGKKLKAVIPGGSSTPVLTAEEAYTVNLDYESLEKAGSMLGSGAMIIIDEETCMVWVLTILEKFYAHESCGQCPPCREGTAWMHRLLCKIERGEGTLEDLDKLEDIANNIGGKTICVLSDAAAMPAQSFIKKFRHEFEEHIKTGHCRFRDNKWTAALEGVH